MASKLELAQEAERRGLELPPRMQALLAEARRRGLIGGEGKVVQPVREPQRQSFGPQGQFQPGSLPGLQRSDLPFAQADPGQFGRGFSQGMINNLLALTEQGAQETQLIPRLDVFQGQDTRQEFSPIELPRVSFAEGGFPTTLGEIFADAATLAIGRVPFARELGRAPFRRQPPPVVREFGLMRELEQTFRSPKIQRLMRGLGRTGETGLEGALIGIMNEGDPLEVGAFSAGAQALGSSILQVGEATRLTTGGPLKAGAKITIAAGAVFGLSQLFTDQILDTLAASYDKVLAGIFLGGVSAALGTGRIRGREFAANLPELADILNTLPRGAMISTISELVRDPELKPVVEKLSTDPEFFSDSERERLGAALLGTGDPLSATVREMAQETDFRRKLEALREPTRPQLSLQQPQSPTPQSQPAR